MSSIQDRLQGASLRASKKIHDNTIKVLGTEANAIRVEIESTDFFGDEETKAISNDIFDVVLDIPNDFPLERYRADDGRVTVTTEGIYFWDIIPLELFVKWGDENTDDKAKSKILKGDLILYIVEDEDDIIPILFRVSETLGSFKKHLAFLKYAIAPYNGIIEDELQILINNYINAYKVLMNEKC